MDVKSIEKYLLRHYATIASLLRNITTDIEASHASERLTVSLVLGRLIGLELVQTSVVVMMVQNALEIGAIQHFTGATIRNARSVQTEASARLRSSPPQVPFLPSSASTAPRERLHDHLYRNEWTAIKFYVYCLLKKNKLNKPKIYTTRLLSQMLDNRSPGINDNRYSNQPIFAWLRITDTRHFEIDRRIDSDALRRHSIVGFHCPILRCELPVGKAKRSFSRLLSVRA